MTRRRDDGGFLLPATVDPERFCVQVMVPKDLYHMAAFSGALDVLAHWYSWQRDEAHRAREVAAVWREIVDQVRAQLDWSLENCPTVAPFDVRQNEANPCTLEKTSDGETWTAWANLRLCRPTFRVNVFSRRLEWSADGIDFYEVPDGYTDYGTPHVSWPEPRARSEQDAKCAAAANAAVVLKQFYVETWEAFERAATGTVIDIARALTSVGGALGGVVGLEWSIDLAQEAWEQSAQFTESAFTPAIQDDLTCILYCRAEAVAGTVTFDYAAVRSAIGARYSTEGGVWGPINALLFFIGADGLNTAGGVKAGASYDCQSCDECVADPVMYIHEQNVGSPLGTDLTYEGGDWWRISSIPFTGRHEARAARTPTQVGGAFDPFLCFRVLDWEVVSGQWPWDSSLSVCGSGSSTPWPGPYAVPTGNISIVRFRSGSGSNNNPFTVRFKVGPPT